MRKNNKRLFNQTYTMTVEGECEKYYFEHLKKLINENKSRIANCQFKPDIAVKKSPLKHAKAFNGLDNKFFHIQDIEDYYSEEHKKVFYNTLEELKNARKYVKYYKLGYTNFSFELWILLHKRDMTHSISNRKKYISIINESYGTNFEHIGDYKEEQNFKKILNQISLDDVYQAIKRAKEIRLCNECETCKAQNQKLEEYCNYTFFTVNPDLDIHEIIETILVDCFGKKISEK